MVVIWWEEESCGQWCGFYNLFTRRRRRFIPIPVLVPAGRLLLLAEDEDGAIRGWMEGNSVDCQPLAHISFLFSAAAAVVVIVIVLHKFFLQVC
jgi:hypothetical protein